MKKILNVLYYLLLFAFIMCIVLSGYYYITKSNLSQLQSKINNNFVELKNKLKYNIKYENNANNIDNQRTLIELNFSGIPDKYDINGNKLKGQEPNIAEAIKQLRILINDEDNEDPVPDIQRLVFIYRYGAYDFNEDKEEALKIVKSYNDIIHDPRLDYTIDELEKETGEVFINDITAATHANTDAGADTIDDTINIIDILEPNIPGVPEVLRPIQNYIRPVYNFINHYADPNILLNIDVEEQRRLLEQFRRNVRQDNRDDPQNVHSPTVIATTMQSINNIKDKTEQTNSTSFKEDILNYIMSKPASNKREDAVKSLNHVFSTNGRVSAFDSNEVDALGRVWSLIKDNSDTKDILYSQLSSMVENNNVVCATGRLSRIIDTLSGIDNDVRIVPEHEINNEMLAKSAILRKTFYNNFGTDNADMLDRGTHPNQDNIDADLRANIKTQLKNEYVQTGILKEPNFDKLVNDWINEI